MIGNLKFLCFYCCNFNVELSHGLFLLEFVCKSGVELSGVQSMTPGGGVLPIMAYTGRLRPKGVPFSGFKYMKG